MFHVEQIVLGGPKKKGVYVRLDFARHDINTFLMY